MTNSNDTETIEYDPTAREEIKRLLTVDEGNTDIDIAEAINLLTDFDNAIKTDDRLMLSAFSAYCDTDFDIHDLQSSIQILNGDAEHA